MDYWILKLLISYFHECSIRSILIVRGNFDIYFLGSLWMDWELSIRSRSRRAPPKNYSPLIRGLAKWPQAFILRGPSHLSALTSYFLKDSRQSGHCLFLCSHALIHFWWNRCLHGREESQFSSRQMGQLDFSCTPLSSFFDGCYSYFFWVGNRNLLLQKTKYQIAGSARTQITEAVTAIAIVAAWEIRGY